MQPAVHSHGDHLIALKREFCPTVCQGSTVLLALVWCVALGTRPVVHPAPAGVGVFGGCRRACQPTHEPPVQIFPWSRVLPAMPCPSKLARVGEPGRRRRWRPRAGISRPARCLVTVCFCSLTRALLQAWACPHRPCQGKACRGLPRSCTVRFM